ncbi:hypothetical protein KIL84_002993, partial [Mauremys mutica]
LCNSMSVLIPRKLKTRGETLVNAVQSTRDPNSVLNKITKPKDTHVMHYTVYLIHTKVTEPSLGKKY